MATTRGRLRKRIPSLSIDRGHRRGADPRADYGGDDGPDPGARQGHGGFRAVTNPSPAEFFAQHGLLFQPKDALEKSLAGMTQAEPLLQDLGDRPEPARIYRDAGGRPARRQPKESDIRPPPDLRTAADTLENVWRAGRRASPGACSTRAAGGVKRIARNHRGPPRARLFLGTARPRGDRDARRIAAGVAPQYQASVRLTGPVAMSDEEFGTIKENAARNGLITFALVLLILWLALRSARLILAVFINLMVGLPLTAALGLFLVGAFNVISVYFAVLFVGIGVDFAIQYSVRYRAERHALETCPAGARAVSMSRRR